MSLNLILICLKLMLFVGLSCSLAAVTDNKDNENADLQTSATSAKLLNLGSLFGYGASGSYYPNNNYRPGCNPCYGYTTNGAGYYPSFGRYPTTNFGAYYPNNNNNYPATGTNILGGGYGGYAGQGGYGGYGGYGGNGALRQYYGYYDPAYTGQRNLGYAYYTNSNKSLAVIIMQTGKEIVVCRTHLEDTTETCLDVCACQYLVK